MPKEDIDRGLSVQRAAVEGWQVVHAGSHLSAGVTLKYQREARKFRGELLATGCDFTRPYGRHETRDLPNRLQLHPAWNAAREVMQAWRHMDITPHYDPLAPVMTFCCIRNADGLIHVTNVLAGMTGQHHVHDNDSFAAWRSAIADEDILWDHGKMKRQTGGAYKDAGPPHCPCGLVRGEMKDGA